MTSRQLESLTRALEGRFGARVESERVNDKGALSLGRNIGPIPAYDIVAATGRDLARRG